MQSMRPYDDLDHERVLAALEQAGFPIEARVLELNSFENRVFQVGLENGEFVVAKFYRPQRWSDAQILEEHAFTHELAAAELPVVAPLGDPRNVSSVDADPEYDDDDEDWPPLPTDTLFDDGQYRFSVSPRRGGRAPSTDDPQVRATLARYIARIHLIGARASFVHRQRLDCATFGVASRDAVLASEYLPADFRDPYERTSGELVERIDAILTRFDSIASLRLHGDCHLGNVLWRDDAPHFVDFDDARSGPAMQDLWMLLSGDADEQEGQLDALLAEYRTIRDIDPAEARLVEPLRSLRILHHTAWIARRWEDPAFPRAFPDFAAGAWWARHIGELREQQYQLSTIDL